MPSQTFRAAVAALAIAGAVALLAAACGGDDDKPSDSGTSGTAASRTARASGATSGTPGPDATPGAGDQTPGGGTPGTPGARVTPGASGGTPPPVGGTPAPGTTPGSIVTMPPPGTTPIPPEPAPPGVAMIAGTASASVGANATVTITLKSVPLPGIKGYSFEVDYNDGGISRQSGTTAECQFGMNGVSPVAMGASPYLAGCVFLPLEGATPTNACSPGPCTLATIVFRCDVAGTHTLTLDPDQANYAGASADAISVPVQNGRVTCT